MFVGLSLDFDGPLALLQIPDVVVELDREIALPHRQHGPHELGNLLQQIQHVDVRLLLIVKMRLPRVGGEADQFAPLARVDMRRRGLLAMRRSVAVLAVAISIAISVAAGLAQSRMTASVRIQPERLEGQPFGCGSESQQQGTGRFSIPMLCLRCRSMAVSGEGRGRFRRQVIGQRRNLIRNQFLNLVQAGNRDGPGKFGIRGRRTHRESVGPPVDDRVVLLLVDLAVDDRVHDRQLDLANLAVAINAAALFQLVGAEVL